MKYMMLFWVDEFADLDAAIRLAAGHPLARTAKVEPGLTHDQLMTTIELYGQQVVPRVRELLG